MKKAEESNYIAELNRAVYQQLLAHNVISSCEKITIEPYYCISLNGTQRYHYIIACSSSQQRYFLKTIKGNDGTLLCNEFLRNIRNDDGKCAYPTIIVPEFECRDSRYYITTFLEGQTLDDLSMTTSQNVWDRIADGVILRLNELEMIQAPYYSEDGKFVFDDCASILKQKLLKRLQHPLISAFSHKKLGKAYERCCEILEVSQFSRPTLQHMDIKPANIIYNSWTGSVSLIDFEFARFGDIDYGWTQVLLSKLNRFNETYKKYLIPRLTKNRIGLEDILDIPKFQCYLFYQTMCNLIYYYDHNLKCPEEINALFHQMTEKINGDYI